MWRFATAILAATLFAGATATAQAQPATPANPSTMPGATAGSGASSMSDAQISQQLQAQGYTVRSLRHEGNYVEAQVAKGGQTAELRINPQTGAVSQAQDQDQDEDNDNDNDEKD